MKVKAITGYIKGQTKLFVAVTLAAVVGGATGAIVLAAVPDSGGIVHGCYRNSAGLFDPKGTLRVIDTGNGDTCTAQETALNWSQGEATTVLHDANGQIIGDLLSTAINGSVLVFNHNLHRVVSITTGTDPLEAGDLLGTLYQDSDCTGQPYIGDGPDNKTNLFRTAPGQYAIVADATQPQTLTFHSFLSSSDGETMTCSALDPTTMAGYAPTTVSLPFSTPLALPFKF